MDREIDRQARLVDRWRQPSTPLLFELVRALDELFVGDMLSPPRSDKLAPWRRGLSGRGVNQALLRMMPDRLRDESFLLVPSSAVSRQQADDLLVQAGILQMASKLRAELAQGLLDVTVHRANPSVRSGFRRVIHAVPQRESYYVERVTQPDLEWFLDLRYSADRGEEVKLEDRHRDLFPELARRVDRFVDWGISYSTSEEIDDYFLDWGRLYLRRMWGQDLIGLEDRLGEYSYNEYLGVLVGVAGRAQKHLCYASILKARHPELRVRDLLTTFSPRQDFVTGLAVHLGAYETQIERILDTLTLSPSTTATHTASGDVAWAPLIRASRKDLILPVFGIEHMPFRFLLRDLKSRFPEDWFEAANGREARWLREIAEVFPRPRFTTVTRPIVLRDGRTVRTDLDAAVYEPRTGCLALFQLKWQDPVGLDDRARASASSNFRDGGNRWVEAVSDWMTANGLVRLSELLGFDLPNSTTIELFVVGRYFGPLLAVEELDPRATWCDWFRLVRALADRPLSLGALAELLRVRAAAITADYQGDSFTFPVGDTAIIFGSMEETDPESEPINL